MLRNLAYAFKDIVFPELPACLDRVQRDIHNHVANRGSQVMTQIVRDHPQMRLKRIDSNANNYEFLARAAKLAFPQTKHHKERAMNNVRCSSDVFYHDSGIAAYVRSTLAFVADT